MSAHNDKIIITKADKNDIAAIQELNLMMFKKENKDYDNKLKLDWTYGNRGYKYFQSSLDNKNALTLVAKDNNQVVGYLIGWIKNEIDYCRKAGKNAELENMFVSPKYRNRGIGQQLVNSFFAWSKKQKVNQVKVFLYYDNFKAQNFYHKCGFKKYSKVLEVFLK